MSLISQAYSIQMMKSLFPAQTQHDNKKAKNELIQVFRCSLS